MLIDTHCHLDAAEFADDRPEVIAAARQAGVGGFVVPGVEIGNFAAVRHLAANEAGVWAAFGIHPLYVAKAREDDLAQLPQWLDGGQAVAVGEIGLDGFVDGVPFDLQERYFVAQLRLAREFGLPAIMHVRRAVDSILKYLRRIEVPGGIAHAFNGSRQQADQLIAMGFRLGFGGTMTFAGSRRIRELAATLPLTAIVLETDAPDIPPEWARGQRNEPANIARYAAVLAELRGVPLAEVIEATGANARAALPALAARRRDGVWSAE